MIRVDVIKPKALSSGKKHPAYFYAHAGGAVANEASLFNPFLSWTALNLNCIVFNVDYRLGPEFKAPKG